MRPLVTVSGYALPDPSYYDANTATIVDAGRNLEGSMIGSVIRQDVSKIEIRWRYLTVDEWAGVCSIFRFQMQHAVTFFDQDVAGWVTKTMYCSDRTAGAFRSDKSTGRIVGWIEPRVALIEV